LKELVSCNLPIVSPFLRHVDRRRLYSNFHANVDASGYFRHDEEYDWIWSQRLKGLIEIPVVHCTYLVRRDVIPLLSYADGTSRHEYVIFSDNARKHGISQYIDNRRVYGYLTLDEDPTEAMRLLAA